MQVDFDRGDIFMEMFSLHVKQMCALSPTSFQQMQIEMKLKVDVVTNDKGQDHVYIKFWCPGNQCRIVMAAN